MRWPWSAREAVDATPGAPWAPGCRRVFIKFSVGHEVAYEACDLDRDDDDGEISLTWCNRDGLVAREVIVNLDAIAWLEVEYAEPLE